MSTDRQIAVANGGNTVAAYHRQATDVAGVCKDIVHATAQSIGGRKYVRVEGWQAIATAHGCVASARDVEKIDGGWRAIGEVRRMDTGATIATAEGFLGEDEPVWAKRPEYAKRAMAQTRAISRACRSAFAHVVVLIGGGLETTPAEEVPAEGFHDSPKPAAPVRYAATSKPAPRATDEDVIDVEPVPVKAPAPARKKQPAAAAQEGADWEDAVLIEMSTKSGQGAKGPWTMWKATLEMDNGKKIYPSTFNENIGEVLEECRQGETILVQVAAREYTDKSGETKKGYDLKAVSRQDVPDKAEAQGGDEDSDIPF
jgi:hypothetical protein